MIDLFDRKYGVRTSGYIGLRDTSFDRSRLRDATAYGPVNGWGFRRLLKKLNLSTTLHFLSSGLGRACIIAAEYGFENVKGVELASGLCAVARENIANCRLPNSCKESKPMIEGGVLDYCEHSDDDVFFMYRAFSVEFLRDVWKKLAGRAARRESRLTIIYAERLNRPLDANVSCRTGEDCVFGQAFFVYGSRKVSCPSELPQVSA
jgi:hypothetical protein